MRFVLALLALTSPAFAGLLPSGLDDPFASKPVCLEFAYAVEQGEGDPILHSIALAEGIQKHSLFNLPMPMMAYKGITQNPDNGPINAVLLRSACQSVFP